MAADRRRRRAAIDHGQFVRLLTGRFPEVADAIRPESRDLLHLETSDVRQVVENAVDAWRHWRVYRYLRFPDGCVDDADEYLSNAIAVSFVEDFARGDYTVDRHRAVREPTPDRLRRRVVAVDGRWR